MWTPMKYHLYMMEAKRNLIKVIYCNCFIIFTNIIVVVIHFNGCCYVQVVFTNPRIPFSTVPAAGIGALWDVFLVGLVKGSPSIH